MKKSDLLEVKSQVKWDKINGLWDALVGWAYARTSSAKSRPTTDQTGKCVVMSRYLYIISRFMMEPLMAIILPVLVQVAYRRSQSHSLA